MERGSDEALSVGVTGLGGDIIGGVTANGPGWAPNRAMLFGTADLQEARCDHRP